MLFCVTVLEPKITFSQSKNQGLGWAMGSGKSVGGCPLPRPSSWWWFHSSWCSLASAMSLQSLPLLSLGILPVPSVHFVGKTQVIESTLLWRYFNSLHLQWPYFQARLHTEVLGVQTSTYHCGEQFQLMATTLLVLQYMFTLYESCF